VGRWRRWWRPLLWFEGLRSVELVVDLGLDLDVGGRRPELVAV